MEYIPSFSDLLSVHNSLGSDGGEEELVVDGKPDFTESMTEDDGKEERNLRPRSKMPVL
jgi:hypothetical protein